MPESGRKSQRANERIGGGGKIQDWGDFEGPVTPCSIGIKTTNNEYDGKKVIHDDAKKQGADKRTPNAIKPSNIQLRSHR